MDAHLDKLLAMDYGNGVRITIMICQNVASSNLSRVCYDSATANLDITFHSGSTYHYSGVSQTIHAGLVSATSHGRYFIAYIQGQYPFREI